MTIHITAWDERDARERIHPPANADAVRKIRAKIREGKATWPIDEIDLSPTDHQLVGGATSARVIAEQRAAREAIRATDWS